MAAIIQAHCIIGHTAPHRMMAPTVQQILAAAAALPWHRLRPLALTPWLQLLLLWPPQRQRLPRSCRRRFRRTLLCQRCHICRRKLVDCRLEL